MFRGSLIKRLGPLMAAALLICLSPGGLVESLRRPMRSVQRCDHKSNFVPVFNTENDCKTHCQQTYIRSSHEMLVANEQLAQHHLKQVKTARPSTSEAEILFDCCCIFEAPWPSFVQLPSIGRAPEAIKVFKKPSECLPIVMSINLTKRTKQSYDLLCRYFTKREPLTMLELIQFAEAAAYLNYMQPKHPAIWHLLRNKMVNRIQKEAVAELRSVFFTDLLDVYLPLENYDGFSLKTARFRRFLELKRELSSALKSRIIEKAFDELVMSNMMVDVAAAAKYLNELSTQQFHVPDYLLEGEYDKHDKDLAEYFTLPGLDCATLSNVNMKLQTYLSVFKSLSGILDEKLIYEHMSEKSPHLLSVLETQRVYLNLHKVNCQAASRRG